MALGVATCSLKLALGKSLDVGKHRRLDPETSGCRCKARTCRARSNDRASGWSCDQTATASVLWQGPAWRAGRLMPMRSQEPGWCGRTRAATIPRHSHTALHRPLRMRQPGPRLAASGEHPGQRGHGGVLGLPAGDADINRGHLFGQGSGADEDARYFVELGVGVLGVAA